MCFLGSTIHDNAEIEADVTNKIKIEGLKWWKVLGIWCDKRIYIKLIKGKFYRTTIRPTMLLQAVG